MNRLTWRATDYITSHPWITLAAATLVVLVIFLAMKFRKKKGGKSRSVKPALEKLGTDYAVFGDIVVSAQHGMGQIDFVIVSPFGVFVIKTQHEAGKIWGDLNDREWDFGTNETIYNPVWRNRTHLNALEKILGPTPFIPLVVFVNGKLENDFGPNVVELPHMAKFIKKHDAEILSSNQQQTVLEVLQTIQMKREI